MQELFWVTYYTAFSWTSKLIHNVMSIGDVGIIIVRLVSHKDITKFLILKL